MVNDDGATVTLYGDTEALDLMADINEMLIGHGLTFEDTTPDGADYVSFKLRSLTEEEQDLTGYDQEDEDDDAP